jgi:uncharacterized YccA/Bax inhibitor family protein
MAWFRTNNPTFKAETYEKIGSVAIDSEAMSYGGTLTKTSFLFVLLVASATFGWMFPSMPVAIGCALLAFIVGIVTCFKPNIAPFTAPLYAVLEGVVVGSVSLIYATAYAATKYAGIVPLAVLGTIAVFAVMLFLYATRIIKVTQTFALVVVGATIAIAITYGATILLGFFIPGIHNLPMYQSGPVGIGFSVFVIVIAAMNLALDFNLIETGVGTRAPKFMEWYAGFGLMVTIVWIYFEMLRLLSKLARR